MTKRIKKHSFSKEKLNLAFEFGMTVSDVARKLKIKFDLPHVIRMEDILYSEFSNKEPLTLAEQKQLIILAMLEPKD